jgi:hypothetical protein
MTVVAEIVPKPVIVAEQVALQLPTAAELLPRGAFPEPTSVTESVSPEHATGIPATFTCVTVPALFTLRVAAREEVHAVTLWLPAERLEWPRASVAAAAQAANVATTAIPNPSAFDR